MRFLLIPVLLLALAGCATTDAAAPPATDPLTATGTPAAPPSGTPVAPESPTAEAEELTCESLLDADTVERGTAEGGEIEQLTAEDAEDGGSLARFIEYGGIACRFGADQADNPVLFAYGPITDAQAEKEKAQLDEDGGETGTNENGGTYYGAPDDVQIYVFSPAGYWAYQYNSGFGTMINPDSVSATIEEVVANAPAFY